MSNFDLVFTNTKIASMQSNKTPYGIIENAALAIRNGKIAWFGPEKELPSHEIKEKQSLNGQWILSFLETVRQNLKQDYREDHMKKLPWMEVVLCQL